MNLDIGNIERVDDPSAEQIGHYLRLMPPQSPFLILSAAADVYMQATPVGDAYRVELREGSFHRYTIVPLDLATTLLQAFGRRDDDAVQSVQWKRLSVFNDPYSPIALAVLAGVVILVGIAVLWHGRW